MVSTICLTDDKKVGETEEPMAEEVNVQVFGTKIKKGTNWAI